MNSPKHVAIIMDGNGRWGIRKKKSRNYGHTQGVKVVEKIIEAANSSKILQQYNQNTQTAKDKSVFGSPTFIVGSELFWGDDRLEDAIEWARK